MKRSKILNLQTALRLTTCLVCLLLAPWASAQDTRLTYQGSLEDASQPAQGSHDFRFTLFDGKDNPVGPVVALDGVAVVGGLFSVELDFGAVAFDGGQRFLAIEVRRPGEVDFTALSPRSSVTPAPYAQGADRAAFAELANQANRALRADGLATTGNQPVMVRIDGQRVAQFGPITLPGSSGIGASRVLLGSPANSINVGVSGATIGGGGDTDNPNTMSGFFATIAGGRGNTAGGTFSSTVSGGFRNTASASNAVVSGGVDNIASGIASVVAGGSNNIAGAQDASVGGGQRNIASAPFAMVSGGSDNHAAAQQSIVSGGNSNCAGGERSWAGGRRAVVRPAEDRGGKIPNLID